MRVFVTALGLAPILVALIAPRPAEACGGFFCDRNQPVVQNAERIAFLDHGDGRLTTVVQIQYSGPAERFSWILPMPGVPEVDVSSNVVFQQLDNATQPQFRLTIDDACPPPPVQASPGSADMGATISDAGTSGNDGVTVLASGSVGPFDYQVIRPDPNLPDPATVAVRWLEDNSYDVGGVGPDLLRPYLEMGQNLVAFRLQKTASVGDIRPVALTYRGERAVIPIRLTAIATQADMGVLVWVLGSGRAVPLNYYALEPNLALVNWFRGGSNWASVVTAAANEAGGQGFVTDMAGRADDFVAPVLQRFAEQEWTNIQASNWSDIELDLVQRVNGLFRNWDGLLAAYTTHVPVPDGVSLVDFLNCPRCFGVTDRALPGLDVAAFLADVEQDVVAPVRRSDTLFAGFDWLTRLYTTLSAEEMTKDPAFDFNADLPSVDRARMATARRTACNAPFEVSLPSGRVVVVEDPNQWPNQPGSGMPANTRVLTLGLEGPEVVVEDNTALLDETLAPPSAGSSCRAASPTETSVWLLLGLVALMARRRFSSSA